MTRKNSFTPGTQMLLGAFLLINRKYFPDEAYEMGIDHYVRSIVDEAYRATNTDDRSIAPFATSVKYSNELIDTYPEPIWLHNAAICFARAQVEYHNHALVYIYNYAGNICETWVYNLETRTSEEI